MTNTDGAALSVGSVAGGPVRHIPVLREEVMAFLAPEQGGLFLDGTFGAGGYSQGLLALDGTRVLALDRDPTAIAAGAPLVSRANGRLTLHQATFAGMAAVAEHYGLAHFDGIALDIGVSSMQLDQADRGFSFRNDGPLDMRMSAGDSSVATAADLVNSAGEEQLADIFYYFGEERWSRRIARAIVHDRLARPFDGTAALAALIARIVPHKPTDPHPATRVFQALRIAVNDELRELVDGLAAAERLLAPGGRLAVVTFHSLEDRIVKQFFAKRAGRGVAAGRRLPGEAPAVTPSFTTPKKQPIVPGEPELQANPRARSAKLRIGLRTDATALPIEPALRNLAVLPPTGKQS